MDYVALAVPFFLLAILLELIYGWAIKNNTYRINDTISSLFMGSLRGTSGILKIGIGGTIFYIIETEFSLWRMDDTNILTWVFAFVAYDFFYYWFHRISHERQIFWASHVAHHQSEEYNLSTALRQTGTGFLITWVFYIPLFAMGVPSYVFVSVASINLIYQFWVHTKHIGKLGWYELIFVTPSNHRVHHAINNEYVDKNYGGVFILWDRLFGTFQEELEEEECVYGIRGPIKTFNPIWANLHIYIKILKDVKMEITVRNLIRVLIARTGWSPDGSKHGSTKEAFNKEEFQKHDPKVNFVISAYALLQLFCLSTISVVLFPSGLLNYLEGVVLLFMIILTMYCTTRWLDGKQNFILEIVRIALFTLISVFTYLTDLEYFLTYGLTVYLIVNVILIPFLSKAASN
jgi:alkylglycerol monooxygenase